MAETKKDFEYALVRGCLSGKKGSNKKLYEYLVKKMYSICLRYANHEEEAKDMLQEGFIKIFNNLKNFSYSGSFEGWARRVLVNNCIEHIRKFHRKNFTVDIDESYDIGVEAKAVDNLQYDDILNLISTMPVGYRTVFNLFVIEGYSHKEIGLQLGVSESTSKTQLLKARKHLQQKMGKRS
jgi:RNA polymerase sigma-70 factor (ECF subfamily)